MKKREEKPNDQQEKRKKDYEDMKDELDSKSEQLIWDISSLLAIASLSVVLFLLQFFTIGFIPWVKNFTYFHIPLALPFFLTNSVFFAFLQCSKWYQERKIC